MKIDYKSLLLNILIPVLLGSLVGFITSPSSSYSDLIQPSFAPPGIVFPIVWTILYTLMGISSYLIYTKENIGREQALATYGYQLIVNFLWPVFFFNFQWYFFSFLWLVLLWILVAKMILEFGEISKAAALMNIPYLLWLSFAGYLNLGIWLLN